MCLFFCFKEKEEGRANVGLRARVSFIAIYVFKGVCKITMQTLHSNHTLRWESIRFVVYSLCVKPYINYTLNYTLRVKETKSQKVKETKGERRKDRLFETLMFMNLIH